MSLTFVNVFVTSAFNSDSSYSSMLFVTWFPFRFDSFVLAKYLSVTSNSTVNVLFTWFISVDEYSYVNSGLIKSVNNELAVFLSTAVVVILLFALVPFVASSMFLFPYVIAFVTLLSAGPAVNDGPVVSFNVPWATSTLILPLHSL